MIHMGWEEGGAAGYGGPNMDNPASFYGVIAYNHDNVFDGNSGMIDTPANWVQGNLTLGPTGLGLLACRQLHRGPPGVLLPHRLGL